MKNLKRFNLLLCFSLAACGYRWQPDYPEGIRPTISVPFVLGDEDGMLTTEVIHALSASGIVDVLAFGGDYSLQISVIGEENEKIGFRIDPQKVDGKVKKNLLASEGRRTMTIEATLCKDGEMACGPYRITADAEYDYVDGDSIQDLTFVNPAGTAVTVLPFSLGQLESLESAQQTATKPLYGHLAQKVVDAIFSEW